MREPATTLTDYLLALLALIFLLRLARMHAGSRSLGALMFFSGFAAAAIFGGTWHGFFSDGASPAERVIWWLTQVFTGIAASGLVVIGLERFGLRNSRAFLIGTATFVAAFASYAWKDPRFLVTVIASGAATLLCLAGLIYHSRRNPRSGAGLVAAGLVLSLLAGFMQQLGVAIHRVHFDHNATYHVWLFAALGFIYAGSRRIAEKQSI